MLMDIQESTKQVPKALKNRPLPRADCTKYRNMFHLLSKQRRRYEGGVDSLAVESIVAYLNGIGTHCYQERERTIRFMVAMDEVFMEHVAKKQQQARDQASSKT